MTPTTSIRAYLEELKKREEAAEKGPWIRQANADNSSHRILVEHGPEVLDWEACGQLNDMTATFIASARSDIPKLRVMVECLLEAVEGAGHGPRCHTLKHNRPFGEKAREIWDAKGCDCWKNNILTRVGQMVGTPPETNPPS